MDSQVTILWFNFLWKAVSFTYKKICPLSWRDNSVSKKTGCCGMNLCSQCWGRDWIPGACWPVSRIRDFLASEQPCLKNKVDSSPELTCKDDCWLLHLHILMWTSSPTHMSSCTHTGHMSTIGCTQVLTCINILTLCTVLPTQNHL